jgi:hypothetical protein
VVARLAKRHNIVVRLRDNEDIEGGLIARINVPADLIAPTGTATHALPSALHSELDTTSSLAATGHTGQFTSPASRASGIAGAFTGGMPRLRPDGGLVGESQVDRPAQEVAGYPPFAPAYTPGGVSNANGIGDQQGGWTSKPSEAVGDSGDGKRNGRSDDAPTSALFGNPMAEPATGTEHAPPPAEPQAGQSAEAGQGQSPQEVALNVDAPTERLPIYEAVLSQWFEAVDTGTHRRAPEAAPSRNGGGDGAEAPASVNGDEPPEEPAEQPEPKPWVSPGDDGWQAARALLENTGEDVLTNAGLPKRVPKAHLVPGSAAPRHEAAEAPPPPPLPPRSAEAVRGRMSSFQQGVRRGRHALIEAYAGDQSSSDESRKNEEQE